MEESKGHKLHHLQLLSKYLIRERRKRLIIIIDNADQYSDYTQKELFIFAHSLTKTALCGTLISLREGYYYKWQNSPPFDAYESNVYHITAPSYVEILQKRINYALLKCTDIHEKLKGSDAKGIMQWEIKSEDVIHFLSGIKDSLFSTKNTKIIDFLNHTTYPNIREGLKIFKTFLTSGHTNVSEYVLRERFSGNGETKRPSIPMHEFIKSIGLQNRIYYDSEISTIHNLFNPAIESIDHFLKLYLLYDLNELVKNGGNAEKYLNSKLLINKYNQLGYKINGIHSSIAALIEMGLVDTHENLSDIEWDKLPNNFSLCITGKGYYYFNELLTNFSYYDLILQDTQIFDNKYFENLNSLFHQSDTPISKNLSRRIEAVDVFMEYLNNMELRQPQHLRTLFGTPINELKCMIKRESEAINSRRH